MQFYGLLLQCLLEEVGRDASFRKQLKALAISLGLSQLKLRDTRIQIASGSWISYRSYYAEGLEQGVELPTRHLSHIYWGIMNKASPKYMSTMSMMSVMCASFDIAGQVLKELGIHSSYKRMRSLSISTGQIANRLGIKAQLDKGESLAGKRVVVSLDGGRSRVREYNGKKSAKKHAKYDTPWREPKLITVHVLDKDGKIDSKTKPIYQASIQDAAQCIADLVKTLKLLQVEQALQVQFIADGARFIWRRIRRAFKKAGVGAGKIIYSLDYYHAVEHLKQLCERLPLEEKERKKHFEKWKEWLWEGLANSIGRNFKKLIRQAKLKLSQEMKTAIQYFHKHHDRMQYKKFKKRKLLCGSGLVESAIRRVINLRFKGSSTFWCQQNLNKMFTLRCAFLSGRWHNLMDNTQLYVKAGGTI